MKWTYIKDGNIDEIPEGVLCLFYFEMRLGPLVSEGVLAGEASKLEDNKINVLMISDGYSEFSCKACFIIKWCLFEEPSEPEDEFSGFVEHNEPKEDVLSKTTLSNPLEDDACVTYNINQPHMCPVCYGNGMVNQGFYGRIGPYGTSNGGVEKCRSCDGSGVVWG